MSNIQQGINQLFDIGAIASGRWEQSIRESTPEPPEGYTPNPANKGVIGAKREARRIAEYKSANKQLPQLPSGKSNITTLTPEQEYQRQLEYEQQESSYRQYAQELHKRPLDEYDYWNEMNSSRVFPIYVSFSENMRDKAMQHMQKSGIGAVNQRESVRRLFLKQRGERVDKLLQKKEDMNG